MMEERRRATDNLLDELKVFMAESKLYRENLASDVKEVKERVTIQNGKTSKIELQIAKIQGAIIALTIGMPILMFLINRAFNK